MTEINSGSTHGLVLQPPVLVTSPVCLPIMIHPATGHRSGRDPRIGEVGDVWGVEGGKGGPVVATRGDQCPPDPFFLLRKHFGRSCFQNGRPGCHGNQEILGSR